MASRRIAILCPFSSRLWTWPDDCPGDGEEAIVGLAHALTRAGVHVVVYTPTVEGLLTPWPRQPDGEVDDALAPASAHSLCDTIAIVARYPDAMRWPAVKGAHASYLWHLDTGYGGGAGWTLGVALHSRHLFLSDWQRRAMLSPAGLAQEAQPAYGPILRGGAETALARAAPVRNPLSCVYTAGPDRGLQHLLDIWPKIRARVPGASLTIWFDWREIAPDAVGVEEALRACLAVPAGEAVTHIPTRLPLEIDLTGHSLWLYPCHYADSFPVTGIRAASHGVLPVFRRFAALPETLFPSPYSVPATPWAQDGEEEFTDAVVCALRDATAEAVGSVARDDIVRWAEQRTWDVAAAALLTDIEVHTPWPREGAVPRADETRAAVAVAPALWLNVGSSGLVLPRFENIDREPHPGVKIADVRNGLPYGDASAEVIVCSHMIEHLALREAVALAREFHRVLRPCGVLRVSVPDLDRVIKGYRRGGMALFAASQNDLKRATGFAFKDLPPALRFSAVCFADNSGSPVYDGHRTMWDESAMRWLLAHAGFIDIERVRLNISRHSAILVYYQDNWVEQSLIVEATRSRS